VGTHEQVFESVSQVGVSPLQWVSDVHSTHAPEVPHAGVAPEQSSSLEQPTQAPPEHTGVVPPQSAPVKHSTHVPEPTSQSSVSPVQADVLVAEHWPHAPEA
jgi:hypothetical protein